MQAHGETPGDKITFGYLESFNARAALDYLRNRQGCKKVAVIGNSMGGAASLLGPAPLDADAMVLEGVYPTIEEATANRMQMRFGEFGAAVIQTLIGTANLNGLDLAPLVKRHAGKTPHLAQQPHRRTGALG